ncbi:hypothetical protein [Persicobacter psychrovividus]|uniref:Lipoprotein n=1 Tax=Persicobacter psychrovividus TaxID=387638 RepID=A0ABN6LJK9_9BACT|nr:hypothetical protein PEPS_44080 [Persicobacter psychrovividus]
MKKVLWINSLLLLMLTSCTLKNYHQFKRCDTLNQQVLDVDAQEFGETNVFEISMDIYKHHFSGLLVIKKKEDQVYRLAMISHIGLSIFDMEVNKGHAKINHIIPALDKKMIVKLFESDFTYLFSPFSEGVVKSIYSTNKDDVLLYKIKEGKELNYYFIRAGKIAQIDNCNSLFKLKSCSLKYIDNTLQNVNIQHFGLKIKIELKRRS